MDLPVSSPESADYLPLGKRESFPSVTCGSDCVEVQ
jgi:hypothetical protein